MPDNNKTLNVGSSSSALGTRKSSACRNLPADLEICSICNLRDSPKNKGKKNDLWLECTLCLDWVHPICANITEARYIEYKSGKVVYLCKLCVELRAKRMAEKSDRKAEDSSSTSLLNISDQIKFPSQVDEILKCIMPQLEILIKKVITEIIQDTVSNIKQDVDNLITRNTSLENRVFELECGARANNIIIRGCPDGSNVSPIDVTGRISELIDFKLHSHDVLFAKRLLLRSERGIQMKRTTHPHILVGFSCPDVKIGFVKSFINFTKIKSIKVVDLFKDYHDGSSGVSESLIRVGDHLDRKTLHITIAARKLLKDGIINKTIMRGGILLIRMNEVGSYRVIRCIEDLNDIVQTGQKTQTTTEG